MAEATDGEDDAPMPDVPPERELIDMPPAPASAPPMPRVRRRTTMSLVKNAQPSSHSALCCHTCPLSRVWCLPVVSRVRCLRSVCPAQDSQIIFCFFGRREERWPQMVSTQGDFCDTCLRARRATDRDLESVSASFLSECLDMCTAGNRP